MSKILLVTVGGSFQPIVTVIRSLQPDRVIFIASDGEKGSKSQVIGGGLDKHSRFQRVTSRLFVLLF